MRGELKLISIFPPFHSFMPSVSVSSRKMLCVWTSRPIHYPPPSLCSSKRLSFLLVWSHASSPTFDLTTHLPDLRVVCLFPVSFGRLPVSLSSSSVSPFYIYVCTRSYCRFYSCMCSSLHNCPTSFPCAILPLCLFLSRFSFGTFF